MLCWSMVMVGPVSGKVRTAPHSGRHPLEGAALRDARPSIPRILPSSRLHTDVTDRRRILMGVCLLAAAGFVRLGIWQLHRLRERRATNRVVLAARDAPVVTLTGSVLGSADSLVERRVLARGRYDDTHDIVLRGEALQGSPRRDRGDTAQTRRQRHSGAGGAWVRSHAGRRYDRRDRLGGARGGDR